MTAAVGTTPWSPERMLPARLVVVRADGVPDRPGSRPGTSSTDSSGTGSRWGDGRRRGSPGLGTPEWGDGAAPGRGGRPHGERLSGAERAAWRAVTRDPYEEALAAARFAHRAGARSRFEMAEHRIDIYL